MRVTQLTSVYIYNIVYSILIVSGFLRPYDAFILLNDIYVKASTILSDSPRALPMHWT